MVIGENNTGKSNFFQAIRLCLDSQLTSAFRSLHKDDVHCHVDLAQSIFGFTGADPSLVGPFGAHIHARTDLSLSQNFRSSERIVGHGGRVVIVRLLREATRLAERGGAVQWLDEMSARTGEILFNAGYVDRAQAGMFYASVQEMKADMARQGVDTANLTVSDLGLFASPSRALRLSTIHYSKGREYAAVAMIGLRQGTFPHFNARSADAIEAEKRLFYVGVTRAERLLMYVAEQDRWNNPPSPFLGAAGVGVI